MRTVLITGATSGFGKLLVHEFLQNGDRVIATGRRLNERPEVFASERASYGNKLIEIPLDVTSQDEISRAREQVEKLVGSVGILINNAGYGVFGALEDLSEKAIRYQMEVNFFGIVSVTRAFLPMLRASHGKIFNFSSGFGYMGFPLTSLYCASKFAVEGLTESLRGELSPHGVQVCLIQPGGYSTNFNQNVSWPQLESSVYSLQTRNYQRLQQFQSAKITQDPREVSRGLLRLSKRRRLPMRKLFGRDNLLGMLSKRLLPACVYFAFMDLGFKFLFLRKN